MSDLAARLTERLRRRDEKIAALEACIEELEQGLQVTCEREAATTARYDTRIEALEARIAKADALATHADILLKQGLNTGVAKEIVVGNLVSTLAAYREGSDT